MVKKRQDAGIIQRCYPKLFTRIKLKFFRNKPRQKFESALFRIGRNEKSIFWYWEIDYELEHYRDFKTIDLREGEKRFKEEDFASWPEWEDV